MARRDDKFSGLAELARQRRDDNDRGSIEDAIGGYTPGGGGDSEGRKPLGVPDDYSVDRQATGMEQYSRSRRPDWRATMGRPVTARPRYFTGDEWKPAAWGPDAIAETQRGLAIAGYLDLNDGVRIGAWDDNTRSAYESLLSDANAAGLAAEEMLVQRAEAPMVGGEGAGGHFDPETGEWIPEQYVAPPLELRTSNKADLRRLFRAAVIDQMGEGWSQAQINELVDAYNWEEIRVQKEAYDQAVAMDRAQFEGTAPPGGGGIISTVDVASPEAFAEERMIERDPEGYHAAQVVEEAIPAFLSMLDGWVA